MLAPLNSVWPKWAFMNEPGFDTRHLKCFYQRAKFIFLSLFCPLHSYDRKRLETTGRNKHLLFIWWNGMGGISFYNNFARRLGYSKLTSFRFWFSWISFDNTNIEYPSVIGNLLWVVCFNVKPKTPLLRETFH